jgi:hypothetical protein
MEDQPTKSKNRFTSILSVIGGLVGKGIVAIIVLLIITGVGKSFLGDHTTSSSVLPANYYSGDDYDDSSSESVFTESEAIESYWDDIKEYVNGTETVEACYQGNGNCYDLEADISDGTITTLYFNNGGNLDFSADIDESGEASDTDDRGNDWEFTIDMDSSLISDAVDDWASNNDYTIE